MDQQRRHRKRRTILFYVVFLTLSVILIINLPKQNNPAPKPITKPTQTTASPAIDALNKLAVKGRAPKTGYNRDQFGKGWATTSGCDTRNIILHRDLIDAKVDEKCNVVSGTLNDPYTGKTINFTRGGETSGAVQIDHVVALSDAWQKGAQQLTSERRMALANDPLDLLAVDGPANLQKSDGDAATWLPPNKDFRCQYVARQVAVKQKYELWVTQAEYNAIASILNKCPGQLLPNP